MELLFLSLYDYFRKNRPILYGLFLVLFLLAGIGAIQIRIEEDISKFFPNDKKLEKINQVSKIQNLWTNWSSWSHCMIPPWRPIPIPHPVRE